MSEEWVVEKNFGGEDGWTQVGGSRTTEDEAREKYEYERIFTAPEIDMRIRKL